jgi:ribonucleotide monophosphatase NagD (HAD superfamily)
LKIAMAALRRLKAKPDEAVVVGDQVDPDIRMGKSVGCRTVLVLTGGTSAGDARRIPARWRPDTILTDVSQLPDWIAAPEVRT